MEDIDLDTQVEARQDEAERRKFFGKACTILDYIPSDKGLNPSDQRYAIFNEAPLHIQSKPNLDYKNRKIVYVKWDNGLVFEGERTQFSDVIKKADELNITAYVPGEEWEATLEKHYQNAIQVKATEIAKEKTAAEKRICSCFECFFFNISSTYQDNWSCYITFPNFFCSF